MPYNSGINDILWRCRFGWQHRKVSQSLGAVVLGGRSFAGLTGSCPSLPLTPSKQTSSSVTPAPHRTGQINPTLDPQTVFLTEGTILQTLGVLVLLADSHHPARVCSAFYIPYINVISIKARTFRFPPFLYIKVRRRYTLQSSAWNSFQVI